MRNTPEGHKDHADVSQALDDMQEVAIYIDKKKEEAENIAHIMMVQDNLFGKIEVIFLFHSSRSSLDNKRNVFDSMHRPW